ncbi:saccharopine dehydrogenase family protein [Patulibacter defluvii]|uniref:saccharopine dehydrogenase family protein n=1 Tax=Patulibacter defluvii TaxID=3095358 RepID=UPI002A750CF1|nr:saccharopine dehydrogenase NADP-binding domain-containing protein [Patulibacter sp. DM4]
MADDRRFDLVLFGATGFTGGLTAEYLARHAPDGLRWALVGRNRAKLEAVRERLAALDPRTAELELLEADAADPASLARVAEATKVVVTTVGPYALHGEPLVAACAAAGTDYLDLTGEPEFVDRMYNAYHEQALATGARIVHCCGFDSIPHDLGAYFTVLQLPEGVPLHVEGYVRAGGQPSGGTFHSAVNGFARARQMAAAAKRRRQIEPRPSDRRVRPASNRIRRDEALGGWVVPLPTVDPQIVRRSARALERYGPDFVYGHYLIARKARTVATLAAGVPTLFALAQLPPTRKLLLKAKAQGEGPSPEVRAKSWFRVRFVGTGGGQRVVTEVSGGDPGYDETAKMLAESGLCLALDELPPTAGQVTTAQAMGDALLARLQAAGIAFRVVEGA